MMKSPLLAAAILVAAAFVLPAGAQDAMKKDTAVKPADSPSKVVLDSWNDVGRKLIAMAEDFPEDKYDFKPTPAQRSFAEQLLHAAGANYFFTSPAMGQKPPSEEDPKRDQYKTKADVFPSSRNPLRTALPRSRQKAIRECLICWSTRLATSKSGSPISRTALSNTTANTTANWWVTIGWPDWCHRNRGQKNRGTKVARGEPRPRTLTKLPGSRIGCFGSFT